MKSTFLLGLTLLFGTVEVHSQQTFPYISFMGGILANNSYVNLSLVGSSESNSVQCRTDLVTCCSSVQGIHRGDWYFPDETGLPFFGNTLLYEFRGVQRVDLRHMLSASSPPDGIYRCDVPTNAVHDDTDNSVRETLYVGIYPSGQGKQQQIDIEFCLSLSVILRLSPSFV